MTLAERMADRVEVALAALQEIAKPLQSVAARVATARENLNRVYGTAPATIEHKAEAESAGLPCVVILPRQNRLPDDPSEVDDRAAADPPPALPSHAAAPPSGPLAKPPPRPRRAVRSCAWSDSFGAGFGQSRKRIARRCRRLCKPTRPCFLKNASKTGR